MTRTCPGKASSWKSRKAWLGHDGKRGNKLFSEPLTLLKLGVGYATCPHMYGHTWHAAELAPSSHGAIQVGDGPRAAARLRTSDDGLMLFPPADRVIYHKNPLAEVICQLRFPRILKINAELPAAFQERIRAAYPVYSEPRAEANVQILPEWARMVGIDLGLGAGQTFNFSSADDTWKVTLTSQSLALTATHYTRWEDFKAHLEGPLAALIAVYSPAFFTRIGLRYRNVIRRSGLGLRDVPWRELLAGQVLGELAAPDIEDATLHVARDLLLRLDDQQHCVRVQHGIALAPDDGERCYLIDCDFFLEAQREAGHAITTLDRLNRESGRLFQWCITPRLHAAMEPGAA
jgi:uncharacterized protein (TIGR04255 family)